MTPPLRFLVRDQPIRCTAGSRNGVIPVFIPRSRTTGHAVPCRHRGWVFYRRGDGGQAEQMGYYEVRDQIAVSGVLPRESTLVHTCTRLAAKPGDSTTVRAGSSGTPWTVSIVRRSYASSTP